MPFSSKFPPSYGWWWKHFSFLQPHLFKFQFITFFVHRKYTTSKPLKRDGTQWDSQWCDAHIRPAKSCREWLVSLVSSSWVHWLVRAWLWGSKCTKVFKHTLRLLLPLLDAAGKQSDQLALDTTGRKHTHTQRFIYSEQQSISDSAHFNGTECYYTILWPQLLFAPLSAKWYLYFYWSTCCLLEAFFRD